MTGHVTIAEAATILQISERTVRRWVNEGKLDGETPEGKTRGLRISRDSIEKNTSELTNSGHRPDSDTSMSEVENELVEQLRSEVTFLRSQVEQQARTIERQAEAHAVIAGQLARLELESAAEPEQNSGAESRPEPEPRRRWWQRR